MAQHRLEGLCFNSPAKFSKEHLKQCPMCGIYIMDLEEDDSVSNSDSDGAPEISIHAMTGIHMGDTMLLPTMVSQVPLVALVYSGSTHCFMSTATAERLGLHPTPRKDGSGADICGFRICGFRVWFLIFTHGFAGSGTRNISGSGQILKCTRGAPLAPQSHSTQ
jgi:hypothetical protein